MWISFAHFEMSIPTDDNIVNAHNIYREANRAMKSAEEKEERLMLLESWLDFEVRKKNLFVCSFGQYMLISYESWPCVGVFSR